MKIDMVQGSLPLKTNFRSAKAQRNICFNPFRNIPVPNILMDIYLYRKLAKNLRMLFCQLIVSALTGQKDLLDFGEVFIEFIPSSETPVSTRSRSSK